MSATPSPRRPCPAGPPPTPPCGRPTSATWTAPTTCTTSSPRRRSSQGPTTTPSGWPPRTARPAPGPTRAARWSAPGPGSAAIPTTSSGPSTRRSSPPQRHPLPHTTAPTTAGFVTELNATRRGPSASRPWWPSTTATRALRGPPRPLVLPVRLRGQTAAPARHRLHGVRGPLAGAARAVHDRDGIPLVTSRVGGTIVVTQTAPPGRHGHNASSPTWPARTGSSTTPRPPRPLPGRAVRHQRAAEGCSTGGMVRRLGRRPVGPAVGPPRPQRARSPTGRSAAAGRSSWARRVLRAGRRFRRRRPVAGDYRPRQTCSG